MAVALRVEQREVPFTGEIHPVAAMFPMLAEEELNDLAEDIKANGLLQDCVKDTEGRLIDGRNRLAACERAGVEPTWTTLNGQDPVAFILSMNVTRRHLNTGQQAMAVMRAKLFLGNNLATQEEIAAEIGVSRSRVAKAAVVIKYALDLADDVFSGEVGLNDAYAEARKRKENRDTAREQFAWLDMEYPDLAALVKSEELKLTDAMASAHARKREREESEQKELDYISLVQRSFTTTLNYLDPLEMDLDSKVEYWLKPVDGEDTERLSAERARRCAAALCRYAELKEMAGDEGTDQA